MFSFVGRSLRGRIGGMEVGVSNGEITRSISRGVCSEWRG